jgi:hypothetical protein
MNDDYDYPSFDDHFNGLEEEILSDEADKLTICPECGEICHGDNLHDGVCEDCWDEEATEPYEDDVWADADTLAGAGYGTDEDYGYYGEDY